MRLYVCVDLSEPSLHSIKFSGVGLYMYLLYKDLNA